ncbi:MAG: hypothetical protein HY778_04890 [Betaproteobacteria bacterium]|nr:hypothetical protein [Betaproteobacteria bacterium]
MDYKGSARGGEAVSGGTGGGRSAALRSEIRRDFPGRRLLLNLLRAFHIAGVVGVGSMLLGAGATGAPWLFPLLLVASGAGIMALDWWSNRAWLAQWSGLALLFKLLWVALFAALGAHSQLLFWLILVGSVLVAHAPGRLRHRRWLRRRGSARA